MQSYHYNNERIYNLDDDGDNYQSFELAVKFIKHNLRVNIIEYFPPTWNSGKFRFETDKIELELIFMDFGGTELRVNDKVDNIQLKRVEALALALINYINDQKKYL